MKFSPVPQFLCHVILVCGVPKDSVAKHRNALYYVLLYECTLSACTMWLCGYNVQQASSYTGIYTLDTRRNFKGFFSAFWKILLISFDIDVELPIWWIRAFCRDLVDFEQLAKPDWPIRRLYFWEIDAALIK